MKDLRTLFYLRQVEKFESNGVETKENASEGSKSSSTNSLDKLGSSCTSPTSPSSVTSATDGGVSVKYSQFNIHKNHCQTSMEFNGLVVLVLK